MVPASERSVEDTYERWVAKGVTVIEESYDDVFGRTFLIADPDGNVIRVSPVDSGSHQLLDVTSHHVGDTRLIGGWPASEPWGRS